MSKEVKIKIPDDCELVQTGKGKWEQRKIGRELPKTWEEFCKTHPIKEDEYYLDPGVGVAAFGKLPEPFKSRTTYNRDILPNKETAEAFLALMQLIQLRDCYNDYWKPDWSNYAETKYCLKFNGRNVYDTILLTTSCPLSFKSIALCNQFYENFRDIIEIAIPLI